MITPNATALQVPQEIHKTASAERQARYTAAQSLKGLPVDASVVLDSSIQRVYRMRKGILTSSRLINGRLASSKIRWVPVMVTLTYSASVSWEPKHISEFLNCVVKWGKRAGYKLPYAWVMELQKSGKPHYHVIIWIPRRLRLPRADSRGWWVHGSTNTVRATNPYGYLSKYASKAAKHEPGQTFPKGARIHGIGGLEGDEAAIVAWWKLPKLLRLGAEGSHQWRRRPGGGWLCIVGEAAGQFVDSQWGLSAIDAVHKRVRLVEKPKNGYQRPAIDWGQLISADREYRYELERVQQADVCRRVELQEISPVWRVTYSGGVASAHLTDAPIPAESFPIIDSSLARFWPTPF